MNAAAQTQSHQLLVKVGELRVGRAHDVIVTYGLGSGVALVLYDPALHLGGVLHAMLSGPAANASDNPSKFVDAGADALLKEFYAAGTTRSRMLAALAGGATPGGFLQTGSRNLAVLKKVLWRHGIASKATDTGGKVVRAVTLECETGRCVSTSRDSRVVLLP